MSVEPGGYLTKDPSADLPYVWQWEDWLGDGVAIASSSWEITPGSGTLTKHDESLVDSNRNAKVWLAAGTAGQSYLVRNRIVTNETPPRTDDRSITIRVRER